jgi:hypothetical protein
MEIVVDYSSMVYHTVGACVSTCHCGTSCDDNLSIIIHVIDLI